MKLTITVEVQTCDGSAPDAYHAEVALRRHLDKDYLKWYDASLGRTIDAFMAVKEVSHA